jgi:trehalose/maltose hydrolase-like predicted phosphorylase
MYIPFDERAGIHPQHEGFTDYARWDFEHTPEDHYPLLLHYPYFQLYRKQVVKQAARCDGPAVVLAHLHSNQQRLTAHETGAAGIHDLLRRVDPDP